MNPGSGELVRVNADNVTINGFVLDGSNPALSTVGADQINGTGPYIDVRNGIDTSNGSGNYQAVNNLTAEYNIVQNVYHNGIAVLNPTSATVVSSGNVVKDNQVQNFLDYGVVLAYNAYGNLTGNTIVSPDNAEAPIWIYDFTRSGSTSAARTVNVTGNVVTVSKNGLGGIWANLFHPSAAATLNISGNTVNGAADVAAGNPVFGIYLTTLDSSSVTVTMSGDTVASSGGTLAAGIAVWETPGANVSASGGSIAGSTVGIDLDNVDPNFGGATGTTTLSVTGVSISGTTTGIRVGDVASTLSGVPFDGGTNAVAGSVVLNLSGGSITGATTAIQVQGQSSGSYTATLNFAGKHDHHRRYDRHPGQRHEGRRHGHQRHRLDLRQRDRHRR